MITSIEVDGFKTLSGFKLALNPGLNILVGPNGSGKTNIISFFEFLSHVVEANPSEATSHLGGAGAVFRRIKDSHQANITASVTGCYPLHEARVRFGRRKAKEKEEIYALYKYEFTILFSNEMESVVFARQHFRYRHVARFISAVDFDAAAKDWDLDLETKLENDLAVSTKVRSLRGETVDFFPFSHPGKPEQTEKQAEEYFSRMNSAGTAIPALLIRFSPMLLPLSDDIAGGQTYNIIPSRVKVLEDSAKPPGINSDGSGLSSTLYSLRKRNLTGQEPFWGFFSPIGRTALKRPSLDTLKGYFRLANSSIEDIEVSNDPFSNQLRVTFQIKNGDYLASVPLSLMSDGTLKWLTLLTAALTASTVFSIEEPENYLHPTMQGQFINIMREILFTERKHGCTLMTTHSETLLNHCKPSELIVVSLRDGKTVSLRCQNEGEVSDEIAKTGFGLGYYYIAGALQHD
jgi:predicted ATPase